MDLLQVESIVTTQLKVRVPKLTNNQYPNMSFTNEVSDKTPSFPNVYIHEIGDSEVGNSIPNQTIHAIRSSIQIDVSTNTSKSDARIVSMACVKALKGLRYSVTSLPIYLKDNNIHRFVVRARRVIANGDTF
jgi:hypothetical protein